MGGVSGFGRSDEATLPPWDERVDSLLWIKPRAVGRVVPYGWQGGEIFAEEIIAVCWSKPKNSPRTSNCAPHWRTIATSLRTAVPQ